MVILVFAIMYTIGLGLDTYTMLHIIIGYSTKPEFTTF